MTQLSFTDFLDWRVVVPIDPQPFKITKGRAWFIGGCTIGDWYCETRLSGVSLITSSPATSEGLLRDSPYQVGEFLDEGVISKVTVQWTSSMGWVWVVLLREFTEDEPFNVYWRMVRAKLWPSEKWYRRHDEYSEPECPGPDCPRCNGSSCDLCDDLQCPVGSPCDHDVLDRHEHNHLDALLTGKELSGEHEPTEDPLESYWEAVRAS